jgi:transposase InsO family protein
MTFRFIDDYRTRWSVERMARVLEVSTSGYYAWKRRKPSRKALSDRALVEEIRDIQKRHKRRYGSPRVHAELMAMGLKAGRHRVARLMRLNDLSCLPQKRFKVTTDSQHHEPVAENILDRQFDVAEPNTVWVSDITYIPTPDGWLYLCVVIDLFDRMVVGWSTRTDMTAAIVIDAFAMAMFRRKPKGRLLFHSDRGIQYCCKAFREASLAAMPMLVRSMSRKGNCWDNACAESFFKTLKRELAELDGKTNRKKVRAAVFEYIEVYYNRLRIHSRNGFRPPAAVSKRVA